MNWFEMRYYGAQRQQELLTLAARIAASRTAAGRRDCRTGLRARLQRLLLNLRARRRDALPRLPGGSLTEGCRDA